MEPESSLDYLAGIESLFSKTFASCQVALLLVLWLTQQVFLMAFIINELFGISRLPVFLAENICEIKRKFRELIDILSLGSQAVFLLSIFLTLIYVWFIYDIQSFQPCLAREIGKSSLLHLFKSLGSMFLTFILSYLYAKLCIHNFCLIYDNIRIP